MKPGGTAIRLRLARRPARLYHPDDGWTDEQYRAFVRWLTGKDEADA